LLSAFFAKVLTPFVLNPAQKTIHKLSNDSEPSRGRCRRVLAMACVLTMGTFAWGQSTIFTSSSTPSLVDSNDGNPVEIGVKFRSDVDGYITGLRFYKASNNTGTHVGNIWSTSGALLGSATFTNETASGWQQVTFSTPIPVSANTTYIASYFAPVGHYSANNNYFASTGADSAPLHAPADGTVGGNGVYSYSSKSGFPSNSYQASNYWVDVVFQTSSNNGSGSGTGTGSSGSGTGSSGTQSTIFTSSSTPTVSDDNDAAPVELGLKFKSDSAGSITGVRFYKAAKNTGTHMGHLWSASGTLLGTATFANETSSGWQQANFSTPIAISANTVYIVSYFAPQGHYSDDSGYFSKAVDRAPLHALQDGTNGPNGVYYYSSNSNSGGFPTNGYQASNYWVDAVFQSSQGSTGSPQLSTSASSLNFGSVTVSSSGTQSLSLTSSGTAAVTINTASVSGAGFSLVAGTFPATLSPGQSMTLQVQFSPTSASAASGALTISSNSSTGATTTVALSGTGATGSSQLSLSTTTLSFGSIPINSTASQTLTLTSSGTSAVTVSSASVQGAGFSLSGGILPVTLNPKQSATLQVQFSPTTAGSASGTLAISSNSAGATSSVSLAGTGTTASHEVDLTWNAPTNSPSTVVGYNVYRAIGSGAPQLINSAVVTQTSFADKTVASGTMYNYSVKSVDQNNVESMPSNVISLSIP
jgi:hypothetical protein